MRRYKSSRDIAGRKKERPLIPRVRCTTRRPLHGNDTLHRRIESFPVAIDIVKVVVAVLDRCASYFVASFRLPMPIEIETPIHPAERETHA
jgi:hypothetical protein